MKRFYIPFTVMLLVLLLVPAACSYDDMAEPASTETNTWQGEFIGEDESEQLAMAFVSENTAFPPAVRGAQTLLNNVYTHNDSTVTIDRNGERSATGENYAAFYRVYNVAGGKGFVIVSGDGATAPILGYSTENSFRIDSMPENLKAVLADYRNEIAYRRTHKTALAKDAYAARTRAVAAAATRQGAVVEPLLGRIKWNQSPYYNAYCPDGTPVGCVATATCQIMRYWEYPEQGSGTYRYYSNFAGRYLSFDYNYPLNWNNMPRERLTAPNDDVALLSYGVAVGLEMRFGHDGSYSYQTDVPRVLVDHYGYPATMRNIFRDNYTADQWAAVIRRELDEGRPVQYAGSGDGGGHSFVCDGYADNGYFHFNWGWGGMSDGYFLLHALDPMSLGTGGGNGGFNYAQTCVIGIEPPAREPAPVNPPGNDDAQYCRAAGRQSKGLFIKKIAMANMTNVTGGSDQGYAYYADKEVYLKPGQSVTLAVTPGFSGKSYRMYWTAWIDYDGDGEFESGELVFQGVSNAYDGFRRTFTLPARVGSGQTRMRVIAKWGDFAGPCEVFDYGEVEDYPVVFGNGSIPNPVTPNPEPQPNPVVPDPTPVTPAPATPTYCKSYGKDAKGNFILGVSMGYMMNTSVSDGGYADYTPKVVEATGGQSISYILRPGFTGFSNSVYWSVWVDADDDGTFTDSERIIQKYGSSGVTGRFTVPRTWPKGKHRMRVSMKKGAYATPCEVFDRGEVEDYTFEVQ